MMIKTTRYIVASTLIGLAALGIWGIHPMGPMKDLPRAERLLEEIRHGFHPELAKLLLVMDRFSESNAKIIYDGTEYAIQTVVSQARLYLKRNYRGEAAEKWINAHLTLSPQLGEVIMFKFPDGHQVPLRDVLLEELRRLPV